MWKCWSGLCIWIWKGCYCCCCWWWLYIVETLKGYIEARNRVTLWRTTAVTITIQIDNRKYNNLIMHIYVIHIIVYYIMLHNILVRLHYLPPPAVFDLLNLVPVTTSVSKQHEENTFRCILGSSLIADTSTTPMIFNYTILY
jgi:hypothetical protein